MPPGRPPADAPGDGPTCGVCGDPIPARAEVRCARCDTPHHRDCWAYTGHCAVFACAGTRTQDLAGPTVVPRRGPRLEIASDGRALVEGKPVVPRTVGAVEDVDGVTRDFGARQVDLELDTASEAGLQWTSLVCFGVGLALGFPKRRSPIWEIPMTLWPIALGLMALRLAVDCRYILDNDRRVLVYRRALAGIAMHWKICRFDQVREVAVISHRHSTKHGVHYTFSVALRLPGGELVEVSRDVSERRIADGFQRNLARHLGVGESGMLHEAPGTALMLPAGALLDEYDPPEESWWLLGRMTWGWWAYLLALVAANLALFR